MSKEYYKKTIIELRAWIDREKQDKKRYADFIKRASSPSSKAGYRKNKVDASAAHGRRIEGWKREIENTKASLKRLK